MALRERWLGTTQFWQRRHLLRDRLCFSTPERARARGIQGATTYTYIFIYTCVLLLFGITECPTSEPPCRKDSRAMNLASCRYGIRPHLASSGSVQTHMPYLSQSSRSLGWAHYVGHGLSHPEDHHGEDATNMFGVGESERVAPGDPGQGWWCISCACHIGYHAVEYHFCSSKQHMHEAIPRSGATRYPPQFEFKLCCCDRISPAMLRASSNQRTQHRRYWVHRFGVRVCGVYHWFLPGVM